MKEYTCNLDLENRIEYPAFVLFNKECDDIIPNADIKEYDRTFFRDLLHLVSLEYDELYKKTVSKNLSKEALIFESLSLVLNDENLPAAIYDYYLTLRDVAASTKKVFDDVINVVLKSGSEYMALRVDDLEEVKERVIKHLCNVSTNAYIDEPSVIVCNKLSASALMSLDINNIKGIVVKDGSLKSHAAILASALKIPYIIDCDSDNIKSGELIAISGKDLKDCVCGYQDTNLSVTGSVMFTDECRAINEMGIDGIGLFRTEFLFLSKEDFPTYEEQLSEYLKIVKLMHGKRVCLRTLDASTDKSKPYFQMEKYGNERGIKYSIANEQSFITQIKAILASSYYGEVDVLLPMVSSAQDVLWAKNVIERAKAELKLDNILFGDVKVGAMVESMEAVGAIDEIAASCDFISIGSNDLSMDYFNISRDDARFDEMVEHNMGELLNIMEKISLTAHKKCIKVFLCGELAGRTKWWKEYERVGIDSLSVDSNLLSQIIKK